MDEEEFEEEIPPAEEPLEEETPPVEEPPAPRPSIPITLSVELARMTLSADRVLELQPGNLIELDQEPGSRVDLISGGVRIGTAELLRIGETLGIRIIELG